MEAVEFIGISFRSGSHAIYFAMTMSIFFGVVSFTIMRMKIKKKYTHDYFHLLQFAFAHILVGIMAVISTKFGAKNGTVTSVDCIWYNSSMAFMFFLVHFYITRFYLEKKTRK